MPEIQHQFKSVFSSVVIILNKSHNLKLLKPKCCSDLTCFRQGLSIIGAIFLTIPNKVVNAPSVEKIKELIDIVCMVF